MPKPEPGDEPDTMDLGTRPAQRVDMDFSDEPAAQANGHTEDERRDENQTVPDPRHGGGKRQLAMWRNQLALPCLRLKENFPWLSRNPLPKLASASRKGPTASTRLRERTLRTVAGRRRSHKTRTRAQLQTLSATWTAPIRRRALPRNPLQHTVSKDHHADDNTAAIARHQLRRLRHSRHRAQVEHPSGELATLSHRPHRAGTRQRF